MGDKQEDKKKDFFERYKLLVAARNFHYENFNKWLTYFYVANAAIFVGYMQIITSGKGELQQYQFAVLGLGLIAGILLYWSSKGYYYWNINFIMLVNYYEKELLEWGEKERVYSMFANKEEQNNYFNPSMGANFSTSKIAILFAFVIVFSWGSQLTYSILSLPSSTCIIFPKWAIILTSLFTSFAVISVLGQLKNKKKQHVLSSNTDPLHDLKIKQ